MAHPFGQVASLLILFKVPEVFQRLEKCRPVPEKLFDVLPLADFNEAVDCGSWHLQTLSPPSRRPSPRRRDRRTEAAVALSGASGIAIAVDGLRIGLRS
jgi:hypothetical protein